jgi:hypothetical protein
MSTIVYIAPGETRVSKVSVLDPYRNTLLHHLRLDGCVVLAVTVR